MPETLIYHDGGLALHGRLFAPAGPANGRAMLVVHEADGIGGNVLRHCAMLAERGYVALAADLHGGGRVLEDDEIMPAIVAFRSDPPAFRRRVRAAFDALAGVEGVDPERIAAIGYCFGGMAVLELARSGAPAVAVGSFHGLLDTAAPAVPGAVRARILACTGAKDPLVPLPQITTFQEEMDAAGADWQLIVYGRALHSFTNLDVDARGDPRMAYDASADRQSWAALMTFLDESFDA